MRPSGEDLGLESFLVTVAGVLRQWQLLVTFPALCVALALVRVLVMRPVYRADARFTVEETGVLRTSELADLATRLSLPVQSPSQSPPFFADLATSREVLLAVARARYPVGNGDSVVTLPTPYGIAESDTPRLLKRLHAAIRATADATTGVVTVTAEAPEPRLATAILDTLLQAVTRFNLERRQLRGRALDEFIASRLATAAAELRAAEDSALAVNDRRSQRAVDLRRQLYLNLATAYEQARFVAFRNTPEIAIVGPPGTPYDQVDGKRRWILIGAGLVGLVIGLGVALLRQSVRTLDRDELTAWAAARSAAQDLPVLRALRRRAGTGSP